MGTVLILVTSCDGSWVLNEGNPIENGMNFCYKCGKKILEDKDE